jgi:hypothetical protein
MAERAATATLTAPALAAYDLREAAAIRAFVERHPEVLDALAEAPARIAAVFDDVQRLGLEFFIDPEGGHEGELTLLIPSDASPEEFLDRVAALDESWLLDLPCEVSRLLGVSRDYP